MSQNQNGISIRVSSQNSYYFLFYWIGSLSKVCLKFALWAFEDAPKVHSFFVHKEGTTRSCKPMSPVELGITLEHARTPGTLEHCLPCCAVSKVQFNVNQGESLLTSRAWHLLIVIMLLLLHMLGEVTGAQFNRKYVGLSFGLKKSLEFCVFWDSLH